MTIRFRVTKQAEGIDIHTGFRYFDVKLSQVDESSKPLATVQLHFDSQVYEPSSNALRPNPNYPNAEDFALGRVFVMKPE